MKRICTSIFMGALLCVVASANPIPLGWTCNGGADSCGTSGSDGVVGLSPLNTPTYNWVSTNTGTTGVGELAGSTVVGETNGATLRTPTFSANASDALNFYFDFVTSDGAGFADYAWAGLFDTSNTMVALLFTAQTEPSGDIVPAAGIPLTILATLTPTGTPIIPGAPVWSPLGAVSSGTCYDSGCGYTGWVNSNYVIPTSGSYYLEIGATNAIDTNFQTGLAMDGVTVGGVSIEAPEPGTLMLIGIGLGLTALARRRRRA